MIRASFAKDAERQPGNVGPQPVVRDPVHYPQVVMAVEIEKAVPLPELPAEKAQRQREDQRRFGQGLPEARFILQPQNVRLLSKAAHAGPTAQIRRASRRCSCFGGSTFISFRSLRATAISFSSPSRSCNAFTRFR